MKLPVFSPDIGLGPVWEEETSRGRGGEAAQDQARYSIFIMREIYIKLYNNHM